MTMCVCVCTGVLFCVFVYGQQTCVSRSVCVRPLLSLHVHVIMCEQKMNSVYGLVLGECVYDF